MTPEQAISALFTLICAIGLIGVVAIWVLWRELQEQGLRAAAREMQVYNLDSRLRTIESVMGVKSETAFEQWRRVQVHGRPPAE